MINPTYWPGFPWAAAEAVLRRVAADGVLELPRRTSYKSGYTYVAESVRRMRALVGDPNLKVHPVGGIADVISEAEVRDFLRALTDTDALGGSLYDYRTTNGGIWGVLRGHPGGPRRPRRRRRPRSPTRPRAGRRDRAPSG